MSKTKGLQIDSVEHFDSLFSLVEVLVAFNVDGAEETMDDVNDIRDEFYCRDCDNEVDSCNCGDDHRYSMYDDEASFD